MTDWKHDALASDLVGHLRGYARPAMCWENLQLGPSGSPRPDVFTMEHSYTRFAPTAFEVKVSRADFLRDVQAGKALGYLKYAGALVFACPKGMITKAEVPAGCGLIERGAQVWRWARKPTLQRLDNLPWEAWLKLVMDGCSRESGASRDMVDGRRATEWQQRERVRKALGDDLAQIMANRDSARLQLEREQLLASTMASDLRALRERAEAAELDMAMKAATHIRKEVADLAVSLGLPEDTHHYAVSRALRALVPTSHSDRLAEASREFDRIAKLAKVMAESLKSEAS